MDDLQNKIWDVLSELDTETVLQLFTNYHGTQLLDEGFAEFLSDEGYMEYDTDEEDDSDNEEEEDEEIGYNFSDDEEKMIDFHSLSKEEFLQSYSYLTEADYEKTVWELFIKTLLKKVRE